MNAQVSGSRIGHETYDSIPAYVKLRPIHDKLIVEPIPYPFSEIIEVAYSGRPLRGRVLAAGPGRFPIKYNGPKGKRTKSWESRVFRPNEVKVGDIIQIGGREIGGYLNLMFQWGDRQVFQCREEDVTVVES
jgi:hypothetical protein